MEKTCVLITVWVSSAYPNMGFYILGTLKDHHPCSMQPIHACIFRTGNLRELINRDASPTAGTVDQPRMHQNLTYGSDAYKGY